jgi:hypothetical protein
VTIKHLLALFIIISNTLINSVWASVHLISNEHSSIETPHLHIVSNLKSFLNFGQDLDQPLSDSNQSNSLNASSDGIFDNDNSNYGESEESHFHVFSDLTTQTSGTDSLKTNLSISATTTRYRTLTYSPPTPPPAVQS